VLRRNARTTRWLRLLWPIGLAVLAAGCDDDDGSGPSSSPNAPIISNLRVSYNPGNPTVGTLTQVTFLVDVADPDGDWVDGQCAFVTGNQLVVPVQPAGGRARTQTGTALCSFVVTFLNDTRQIDLRLVDGAGHASNVLSGLANLEGRSTRP
jgi:hypothetical protein